MSIRELWLEFAAARDRLERERHRDLTSCWLIAALSRTKDLPPLQRLLGTRTQPQSVEELRLSLTMVFGPEAVTRKSLGG